MNAQTLCAILETITEMRADLNAGTQSAFETAGANLDDATVDLPEISRLTTFAEAGVMTSNDGLVVCFADGREYQLTLVQSR